MNSIELSLKEQQKQCTVDEVQVSERIIEDALIYVRDFAFDIYAPIYQDEVRFIENTDYCISYRISLVQEEYDAEVYISQLKIEVIDLLVFDEGHNDALQEQLNSLDIEWIESDAVDSINKTLAY
jgi:hypothetical protein